VHAAVIELDALADAVGAGAQDHHGRAVAAANLVARTTIGTYAATTLTVTVNPEA